MPSETSSAIRRRPAWPRVDSVVALIALVILLPSSIALLTDPSVRPGPIILALAIVLYAVLHAASLLAVRSPVVAIVIASGVMCALILVPGLRAVSAALLPSTAAYLLVIAQVAIRTGTLFRTLALGSGVFGALLVVAAEPQFDDAMLRVGAFVGLSGAIAAAWAIGLLLRLRRAQAEERLRMRVAQAIADERMRINRDLHDIVAHSMTVMIAQAEVARALSEDDPDRSRAALGIVVDTGREALRGMRAVVADDAPREPLPTIDSLDALFDSVRTPSIDVRVAETGARGELRPDAAVALHHAVREALTNSVRYAAPPVQIDVRLEWQPDAVHVTIDDDGGRGRTQSDLGGGVGLVGIAERVRLAGGTLTAAEGESRGWVVAVDLPAERSAR
ncbi:histidine kinase [Microbacterium sp. A8/3-1]|uniref:histidine kinase n=1 Tax=Microbacterium sp. A8/3-1 TaxID=3160749 RepID=A0AAU7VUR4_9MICO